MFKSIQLRVEVLFVIIGLIWGFVFLLISPPFQAPDEDDHLIKMWGMLEGSSTFKIFNGKKGQIIPYNIAFISDRYQYMKFHLNVKTTKRETLKLKNIPLNKDRITFYYQTPTSYTIFSYIPAIFVLAILKFFNVAPLFMMYILRFCCLLTYLAVIYQAVKLTPVHKWLFFILALLPTNLYIAASISTDCLVMSSGFMLVAYTLYLKLSDKVTLISGKQVVLWGILFTFLCILKYLYFPLIFLFFLLPKEKFEKNTVFNKAFVLIFALNFIYIILYLFANSVLSTYASDMFHENSMSTVSMIKYIIFHPLQYIVGIIFTPIFSVYPFYRSLISQFGWKPFFISNYAALIFYILIFCCIFYETKNSYFKIKDKLIMALSSFMCYIVILTSIAALYQSFPLMIGFQGRYAGPFVALIFLLLSTPKIQLFKKYIPCLVIIVMQFLYLHSCLVIINRFYF